jgi:hypothetical protein
LPVPDHVQVPVNGQQQKVHPHSHAADHTGRPLWKRPLRK